jgi:hypothetical protein
MLVCIDLASAAATAAPGDSRKRQLMKHTFVTGIARGQKPLLDHPACDCDRELMNTLSSQAVSLAVMVAETTGCTIGPAVALSLAAASLVNPANARDEESRAYAVKAARVVADTLEKIARGIRARADQ